jgi:D-glycero-D-manno-heptose 1,7-bisphosphate phosphatase
VAYLTGVTRIRTCPHSRSDVCRCRKPLPGLLLDEAHLEPVDFAGSWLVGDRDSDIDAGLAIGCRVMFLDRGVEGRNRVTRRVQSIDAVGCGGHYPCNMVMLWTSVVA